MLYPQNNRFRQFIELSDFWDFRFDFDDKGLRDGWEKGFENGQPIAVPASWNEQFAENRDFLGPAWYQTHFSLPWGWDKHRVLIRFNSVNYLADVWLNGEKIGQHEGGHLPFKFDITSQIKNEGNHLVVRVDGNLTTDRVPPSDHNLLLANYPPTNFDFYPFCGIQRPVLLYSIPNEAIIDLTINTSIEGKTGIVNAKVERSDGNPVKAQFNLTRNGTNISTEIEMDNRLSEATLRVPNASFWAPGAPQLYDLKIELSRNGTTFDSYTLPVGIRTISVEGDKLLLNGKPIELLGFGRHEDFPVIGRGLMPAVIIKDYSLMQWIGANSFRTSHYPYSEQMMDLADQLGILIIDETPAVGLTFHKTVFDRHLELCKQYTKELIARDKNHPSVIMWSLANEPHQNINAKMFFEQLYDLAKKLDSTRPITFANMHIGEERSFKFCDIVCVNRYYGWYLERAKMDKACELLSKELDKLYKRYSKPIILSEFGAGTIPGWHANPPEMWSEEYQVEFLSEYIKVANSKPFVVGQHVWNLCDFKTSQHDRRMGGINYKGVFTRDRRPKMAAHHLRKLWSGKTD